MTFVESSGLVDSNPQSSEQKINVLGFNRCATPGGDSLVKCTILLGLFIVYSYQQEILKIVAVPVVEVALKIVVVPVVEVASKILDRRLLLVQVFEHWVFEQ